MPSTSDNRALFAFLGIAFLGIVVVHLLLPREAAGVVTLLLLAGDRLHDLPAAPPSWPRRLAPSLHPVQQAGNGQEYVASAGHHHRVHRPRRYSSHVEFRTASARA